MKIGIIGAGNVGTGIGKRLAAKGHEILVSFSKTPEALEKAAFIIGEGAKTGSVEQAVDPQTEAASKVVAWLSAGNANPTAADFAMLRLLLLSMLPQVGGLLLMIGRTR